MQVSKIEEAKWQEVEGSKNESLRYADHSEITG
jgi:hypothetical protein